MVKRRSKDKKRLKWLKWIALIILIISVIGIIYYNVNDNEELEVSPDTSAPPHHKDFAGYNLYQNTEGSPQQYVFVDDASSNVANYFSKFAYTYIKSAGIQYYQGDNAKLLAGKSCSQQQLIRFVYCDNAWDKSKCNTDIFSNLWLVNTFNDYPNFAEYFTGDSTGFYYSYSCYEKDEYKAITFDDSVERKYLYNDKCISADDPNWKNGDNYNTEDECLDALAQKLDTQSQDSCTPQEYSEYVCKTNNLYQKERLSDCSIGYTEFVKRCDYGCENGACKSAPVTTCTYQEFDEYKCVGDVQYQKVQERDCSTGYTLPVGACTISVDESDEFETDNSTIIINNTQPDNDNPVDLGGNEDSVVDIGKTCEKGYYSYQDIGEKDAEDYPIYKCQLDFKRLVSQEGITDFYKDYDSYIWGVVIVLVIAGLLLMPKGGKKR